MAKKIVVGALDVVVAVCLGAIVYVFLTGGGRFSLGPVPVGIRSTGNPTAVGCLAALLRYLLNRDRPILWVPALTFGALEARAHLAVKRLREPSSLARGRRIVWCLVAASIGLRLLNAWNHPGFYSGDDVEVHEMTFRRLLGAEWPIWDLRNSTFPMVFVYPVQALAMRVGLADVGGLVFVGRLAVVGWATLSLGLVYWIARRLSSHVPTAVLAVVLFGASRLHLWFGASELPRPVATVFVLAGFALLLRPGNWSAAASGVLLAVGGVLRFSELVFLLPAGIVLARQKRIGALIVVTSVALAVSAVVLGASDWLYWGHPFHSLQRALQYTVVDRLSSRGFQPPWYYLLSSGTWTTPGVLALSLVAFWTPARPAALWAWVAIAVLSVLPHKEPRYLIAVLPFVSIAAAGGAMHVARRISARDDRRAAAAALGLASVLVVSVVFELSSWHFRKSDDEVSVARWLAASQPTGIAAEQLWRFGGRLYWHDVRVLVEIDEISGKRLSEAAGDGQVEWILLRNTADARRLAGSLTEGRAWIAWEEGSDRYLIFRRTAFHQASQGR